MTNKKTEYNNEKKKTNRVTKTEGIVISQRRSESRCLVAGPLLHQSQRPPSKQMSGVMTSSPDPFSQRQSWRTQRPRSQLLPSDPQPHSHLPDSHHPAHTKKQGGIFPGAKRHWLGTLLAAVDAVTCNYKLGWCPADIDSMTRQQAQLVSLRIFFSLWWWRAGPTANRPFCEQIWTGRMPFSTVRGSGWHAGQVRGGWRCGGV